MTFTFLMQLKDDQIPSFLINVNEREKLTTGKGTKNKNHNQNFSLMGVGCFIRFLK